MQGLTPGLVLDWGAMAERVVVRLLVNREPVEVAVPHHKTLLEVLREDLGLTGTKHGCELGECGACTVLVEGEPILSCLALPLELEGREILTVESRTRPSRCRASRLARRRDG